MMENQMKTENKSTTAKQILLIGILLLFGVNHLQAANNRDLILDNNRGVAQMGQFEYAKAREIFFRLTKTHPKNLVLKINLAIATLNRQEKGDEKRALAILKRVLDKDNTNIYALYISGLLELNLFDP